MSTSLVQPSQRLNTVNRLFGKYFPLFLEPIIYRMAGSLCEDYTGGYWDFHLIDGHTFFMCPDTQEPFRVSCPNQYSTTLTAEGFGITVCLYAYSQCSFRPSSEFSTVCAQHFHRLRRYVLEHSEGRAILAAID